MARSLRVIPVIPVCSRLVRNVVKKRISEVVIGGLFAGIRMMVITVLSMIPAIRIFFVSLINLVLSLV
jgi:hypothetical protein